MAGITVKRLLLAFVAMVIAALASTPRLSATDINGTVQSATPEYATVTSDSDLIPSPGDKADFFFKLPGADVEISVGSGQVYEITGSNIMVKIEKVTGTVAKDQLVRINSPNPRKKSELEPTRLRPGMKISPGAMTGQFAPTASPPAQASKDPDDVPNTFNEGQSVIEAREKPRAPAGGQPEGRAKTFAGKWKVQNENADYVLTLSQQGTQVTGSYTLQGGSLSGTVRGNTLVAKWRQPGNQRGGSVRLTLSSDGNTISGPWAYDPSVYSSRLTGTGVWTFRRE